MSIIMLAQDLKDLKKELKFPVMVSEKLDGAAAECTSTRALSRRDKPYLSIPHILEELLPIPGTVIGELHIPGIPFKDCSGTIRGHTPDNRIKLGIYDYYSPVTTNCPYYSRMELMEYFKRITNMKHAFIIPYTLCYSREEIEKEYKKIINKNPYAEGICIRPMNHLFQSGKRSWDLLRKKQESTIDLMVTGFDEAISKDGIPKGMVGRINISYNGKIIGAGPGSMKHKERKEIWEKYIKGNFTPIIAEIVYKPDPSYNALREARFSMWREDKTVPDA